MDYDYRTKASSVNIYDEWDLLRKNFSGSGVVPPVDPFSASDMNLFSRIYSNTKHLMTGLARQDLDDTKFRHMMGLLRDGLSIDMEVTEVHHGILKNMFKIIDNRNSNGFKTSGALVSAIGSILYTIPGINALWGTAAYGAGVLLNWIGDESDASTRANLSNLRYSFMDNLPDNIRADNLNGLLKRFDDLDSRMERLGDWMLQQEQRICSTERVVSNITNGKHCLQFWKVDEHVLGFVLYLGSRGGNILYAEIDNTGFAEVRGDLPMTDANMQKLELLYCSSRLRFRNSPTRPCIISEMSLFAPEEIVEDRFFKIGNIFSGTVLRDAELRTAVLLYLQLGL